MDERDLARQSCSELGVPFEIARHGRIYGWDKRIHQSQVVDGAGSVDLTTPATANPYPDAIVQPAGGGMVDIYKPV